MKSPPTSRCGVQVPRIRVTPEAPADDSADVIELARDYQLILDPWRCEVFRAGLGLESEQPENSVPVRQRLHAGTQARREGSCIEAPAACGPRSCLRRRRCLLGAWARTTRLSFERLLAYLDNFDDLRRRVASVQRWVGREQVRFRSGQVIVFPARSRGALRGYSIDRLILTKPSTCTQAQLEAVLPTMSARPNTQSWLFRYTTDPRR